MLMTCPNKNDSRWRKLVELYGEKRALERYQLLPSIQTKPDNYEILSAIEEKVYNNLEYFQQAYSSYLTQYLGSIRTPSAIVAAFYDRVKKIEGEVVDNFILTTTDKVPLFPPDANLVFSADARTNSFQRSLEKLSAKFNIPFEIVNNSKLNWRGKYINQGGVKKVVINIAHATSDTPLHEYYHPFVRLLKIQNPKLYQSLTKQIPSVLASTPDIVEESLTEYLAKEALKSTPSTWFDMFISFLKRIFLTKDISKLTNLSDVLLYLQGNVDLSKENTLAEAYQIVDNVVNKLGGESSKRDIIGMLSEMGQVFTTSDSTKFYQDENGKDVAIRVTSVVGDRELGEFSLANAKRKDTDVVWRAKQIWRKHVANVNDKEIDEIEGSFEYEGVDFTFKTLLQQIERDSNKYRAYGKMIHAYLQYLFEENADKKAVLKTQVEKYATEYGKPYSSIEFHSDLRKIWENIEQIVEDAGIAINIGDSTKYTEKTKDTFASEVTLKSDLLVDSRGNNIATTADGIVQHSNGDLTILDWKTGDITKDLNTPYLLQYGDKFGLQDSKLNRGYLELAFRALIIKEKFPEATFREIKIVKLGKDGKVTNMRLDLAPFLATIGEYYKSVNPSLFNTLTEKGLLTATNYEGTSKSLLDVASQIKNLSYEDQLIYLKTKLSTILEDKTKEEIERDSTLKTLSIRYTSAILELEKLVGTDLNAPTPDIPYAIGNFKNLSDISNPKVQTFHKVLLESKDRISKQKQQIFAEHDRLYKAVAQQSIGRTSKIVDTIATVSFATSIITLSPWLLGTTLLARAIYRRQLKQTAKEHFAFMWKRSSDPTVLGYFFNDENFYIHNGAKHFLTAEQKAYRDFIWKTMEDRYYTFANEVIGEDAYGRPQTRAMSLGLPAELPSGFMPRIFKDYQEIREEEGFVDGYFGIKTNLTYHTKRYFTSFIEDSFESAKGAIPLSFFKHSDSSVVEESSHSFDVEKAFKAFMNNLVYKQEMDPVYNLGVGLSNALHEELDEAKKPRYPNLSKFVDEMLITQVQGTFRPLDFRSRKWNHKMGSIGEKLTGIPAGTRIIISQDRVARALKSTVTMTVMGFKVLSPIRNAAMLILQNLSQTTKSSVNSILSKITGVPDESFDTFKASGALELVRDYYKNKMLGKEDESKLWNIAKQFDWMPDNYPYSVSNESLLSKPIQMSPLSHAYMFYQMGENMATLWHLAALLKGTKVTLVNGKEITLWEAHNKDGDWTAGVRGMVDLGNGNFQELKDLTALEIKTLKRANEKLNGSYRAEEKTAIEANVVGEFFFQFKKYFYQYMKVLFSGEYKDITVGKYVMTGKRPDGMPVYQWHSEVMQGQLIVLTQAILMGLKGRKKLREYLMGSSVTADGKFSSPRVRTLATSLNTMLWLALMYIGFSLAYDDDDEKTYAARQLQKIIVDNSRGMNPHDIFETAKRPIIAAERASQIGDALIDFLTEGLWKVNSKGNRVGQETLLRSTPGVGAWMQYKDAFKNTTLENDPVIELVPSLR